MSHYEGSTYWDQDEPETPQVFPGSENDGFISSVSLVGRKFVMTGEYRAPKKGEFLLSAYRPSVAVQAQSDFHGPFYILREVTEAEGREVA